MQLQMFNGACQVNASRIQSAIVNYTTVLKKAKKSLDEIREVLKSEKVRYLYFWKLTRWHIWLKKFYHFDNPYESLALIVPNMISEKEAKTLDKEWEYSCIVREISPFICEQIVYLNGEQIKFVKDWEFATEVAVK